jgi:hypothetical protein
VELVIWRSVFSLETAPMWVSPTHGHIRNDRSRIGTSTLKRSLILFGQESPIHFRYCLKGLQELLDAFPNISQPKFGHFL